MRVLILIIPLCFVFLLGYSQENKKYDEKEELEIQQMIKKWQWSWNNHNTDSFASLLARDIDYITKSGIWYQGKTATVEHDKANQQTIFKNSILTIDSTHIRYVKPDLAIVHIGWGISGDTHHNGTASEPRHGIYTWVIMKENHKWYILVFNNVNIVTPL